MYQTQQTYKYREQVPQSLMSETVPNQAPDLKYIIGAIQRGENLNIAQSMAFDKEPTFDDVDISRLDLRHLTEDQISKFRPVEPAPETPPSE